MIHAAKTLQNGGIALAQTRVDAYAREFSFPKVRVRSQHEIADIGCFAAVELPIHLGATHPVGLRVFVFAKPYRAIGNRDLFAHDIEPDPFVHKSQNAAVASETNGKWDQGAPDRAKILRKRAQLGISRAGLKRAQKKFEVVDILAKRGIKAEISDYSAIGRSLEAGRIANLRLEFLTRDETIFEIIAKRLFIQNLNLADPAGEMVLEECSDVLIMFPRNIFRSTLGREEKAAYFESA